MTPSEVRAFLQRHGLAAHRSRGQNFLHDIRIAEKLVEVACVGAGDAVLEIGTGLGILTRALTARARRVVSVEIDAGVVRALRAEALLPAEVELLHADALRLDWPELLARDPGPWRVVANLPYSVATPILRRLLDVGPGLAGWGVMVQRELAQRMAARVGSADYGSFSVLHQLCTRTLATLDLHGRCFYPVPRVASRFVSLAPIGERPSPGELGGVEVVARAGFAHRRKMLANALRQAGRWEPAQITAALGTLGVDPRARAETLPPESWLRLAQLLEART